MSVSHLDIRLEDQEDDDSDDDKDDNDKEDKDGGEGQGGADGVDGASGGSSAPSRRPSMAELDSRRRSLIQRQVRGCGCSRGGLLVILQSHCGHTAAN